MTEQSPENKKSKRKAPHPLFRLLDFAGPYKILTVVGCALSGLHSLLAVMPLCASGLSCRSLSQWLLNGAKRVARPFTHGWQSDSRWPEWWCTSRR